MLVYSHPVGGRSGVLGFSESPAMDGEGREEGR